jgi:hypothetical protein
MDNTEEPLIRRRSLCALYQPKTPYQEDNMDTSKTYRVYRGYPYNDVITVTDVDHYSHSNGYFGFDDANGERVEHIASSNVVRIELVRDETEVTTDEPTHNVQSSGDPIVAKIVQKMYGEED